MKTLLRRRLIRWGITLGGPLILLNMLYPVFVGLVGTYVFAGVLLMLTVTLVLLSVRAFFDESVSARVLHLFVGGAMLSVALFSAAGWTIGSYVTGDPGMLVSPVVGGYIILGILGCVMLLTTPGVDGRVPVRRLRILWATLVVCLVIGLIVWGFGLERGLAPAPI